jgi:hypothetical protein
MSDDEVPPEVVEEFEAALEKEATEWEAAHLAEYKDVDDERVEADAMDSGTASTVGETASNGVGQ